MSLSFDPNVKNPIIRYPKSTMAFVCGFGLFGIIVPDSRPDVHVFTKIYLVISEIGYLAIGLLLPAVICFLYREFTPLFTSLNKKLKPKDTTFSEWFDRETRAIFDSKLSFLTGIIVSTIVVIFFLVGIRMPWANFDKTAFLIYTAVFMLLTGVLAYIYFRITWFLLRLNELDIVDDGLVFFEAECQLLHSLFMKLLTIGVMTYILALIVLQLSPGRLALISPVLDPTYGINLFALFIKCFVFGLAGCVLLFFSMTHFLIHRILLKFKLKNLVELTTQLDKFYAKWQKRPSEELSDRLTKITQWIEHFRRSSDWLLNFKTVILVFASVLLPLFKIIVDSQK